MTSGVRSTDRHLNDAIIDATEEIDDIVALKSRLVRQCEKEVDKYLAESVLGRLWSKGQVLEDIDTKRKDMLGTLQQIEAGLFDLRVRKRTLTEELDAFRSKVTKENLNQKKKQRHQAFSLRMLEL